MGTQEELILDQRKIFFSSEEDFMAARILRRSASTE
jgi:hypothetical protein